MPESFSPLEYLDFLRARWKFWTLAVLVAGIAAFAGALWSTKRYTATATLVIEAPAGSDARTSTAVTPIYLESLKTYEQFASADSSFAKAAVKFHLTNGTDGPGLEGLKRRVLRVSKLKDTKLLQISVTLPDPQQAQALAQYLAEESVALNRSLADTSDRELLEQIRKKFEAAQEDLAKARAETASLTSSSSESTLDAETQNLAGLKARTEEQRLDASSQVAGLAAREASPGNISAADASETRRDLAAARARLATITTDEAALDRQLAEKSSLLANQRARRESASDRLHSAEDVFAAVRKRCDDLEMSSKLRTEQLRIVDPGIVPQRPSSPDIPMIVGAALALSLLASLAWLTLQFGLRRPADRTIRTELKAVRGGGR